MRSMPIKVVTGSKGMVQMKAAFKRNWKYYCMEALGLAIFMISACFFSSLIISEKGALQNAIHGNIVKNIVMGSLMGATALFIFYSPWTAPSGSHINPAVTLTYLRLDRMCRYDALFFVLFQFAGGTLGVVVMQKLLGSVLTAAPVSSAVTVPGKPGVAWAAITEFFIAFITMTMVLFTANSWKWMRYTRILSAILVCCWVIFAGPVSGFGMNPARSFASAFPAGIWTSFWIYLLVPFAGMLLAAEFFLLVKKTKSSEKKTLI